VVSFTLQQLYSGIRAPSIQWIGDWVGPRAGKIKLKVYAQRTDKSDFAKNLKKEIHTIVSYSLLPKTGSFILGHHVF
jgi:hypothetical protein